MVSDLQIFHGGIDFVINLHLPRVACYKLWFWVQLETQKSYVQKGVSLFHVYDPLKKLGVSFNNF